MKYGSATMFVFHKKCSCEVEEVVAALPILLEVEFGPSIWTWFSNNAKIESQGFKWQNGTGLVSKEEELEPWETLDNNGFAGLEEEETTAVFTL